MKIIQTGTIVSEGGRDGKIESSSGDFTVDFTDHAPDRAVTAEHLFAGAYAACFHSALQSAARRDKVDITGSTVICAVHLNETDSGDYTLSVEIRASIPGVDADAGGRLLQQAHHTCPYSKAVRDNIPVELRFD